MTPLWDRIPGARWLRSPFAFLSGLFLLTVVLPAALSVWVTQPVFIPGRPSPVDVVASKEVRFVSEALTEEARRRVREDPRLLVYREDPTVVATQREQLRNQLDQVRKILTDREVAETSRREALLALGFSEPEVETILSLSPEEWDRLAQEVLNLYDLITKGNAYTEEELDLVRKGLDPLVDPELSEAQRALVADLVRGYLRPNRFLDETATRARQEAAAQAVPPQEVRILPGEVVVRKGDRITPLVQEKLEALGLIETRVRWGKIVARSGALGLAVLAFFVLTWVHLPWVVEAAEDRVLWGILVTLLLGTLYLGRLTEDLFPQGSLYVLPVPGFILGVQLLLSSQVALSFLLLAAAVAGILTYDVGLAISFLVVGGIALATARRGERLGDLLRSAPWIAIAQVLLLATYAFLPLPLVDLRLPWTPLFLGSIQGLLSALAAIALYTGLGLVLNLPTPLRLLELGHPSHPLLNQLMRRAPGTYHHSLILANLCESAAEAIGADPLLCRVGAYYHDVGKLKRPYFFAENQAGRLNVHEELDPEVSAQLIISHVTDGLAMARAHRLPRRLWDFIAEHHGDMRVTYFYRKALEERGEVDEARFRYPGPRPRSRETGILMLADGVEATVRSLAQAGKLEEEGEALEQVIDQIFQSRIQEGQLDRCPLTLSDLEKIRAAFLEQLRGVYHPRVLYPPERPKEGG